MLNGETQMKCLPSLDLFQALIDLTGLEASLIEQELSHLTPQPLQQLSLEELREVMCAYLVEVDQELTTLPSFEKDPGAAQGV